MIPDQKNLTRPGLHPEIKHGHAGGIDQPFIPPVKDSFHIMFFAAPHERDRFLGRLVLVGSQNFDYLELHFPVTTRVTTILLLCLDFFNGTRGTREIIDVVR
jgi:hypothetical protein